MDSSLQGGMLCRPSAVRDQGPLKRSQPLSMAGQDPVALLTAEGCSGHRGVTGHRKPRGSLSSSAPAWAVMSKTTEGCFWVARTAAHSLRSKTN